MNLVKKKKHHEANIDDLAKGYYQRINLWKNKCLHYLYFHPHLTNPPDPQGNIKGSTF